MKRRICYLMVITFVLLIFSCDSVKTHNITVINKSGWSFALYLDNEFQCGLKNGNTAWLRDIEIGQHTLQARLLGFVMMEKTFYLYSSVEWVVYEDTSEIR